MWRNIMQIFIPFEVKRRASFNETSLQQNLLFWARDENFFKKFKFIKILKILVFKFNIFLKKTCKNFTPLAHYIFIFMLKSSPFNSMPLYSESIHFHLFVSPFALFRSQFLFHVLPTQKKTRKKMEILWVRFLLCWKHVCVCVNDNIRHTYCPIGAVDYDAIYDVVNANH
jgi:hypothetical protein